jgi:hypothetical protein
MRKLRFILAAAVMAAAAAVGAWAPLQAAGAAPLAGTCHVTADYTNAATTFKVIAVTDSCSGGGSVKYQAEQQCAEPGGAFYSYGSWLTSGTSTATDSGCGTGVGGEKVDGYMRLNMNNPVRFTCWVPGDPNTGTCSGGT